MNVFNVCVKWLLPLLLMINGLLIVSVQAEAVENQSAAVAPAAEKTAAEKTSAEKTVAEATPAATESSVGINMVDPLAASGKVAFFLLLIVGLIFVIAWLINKSRAINLNSNTNLLKTVAVLPLGMKEKIALVQVGDQQIVVGVTPNQITHLSTLEQPLQTPNAAGGAAFSELLKKAIQK